MLEKVLGPGQAIVRVSAEVNYDTITKTEEKFDPDGQVIRTQTKNDETVDTSTTGNNTPTGIAANTVPDTNATQTASGSVQRSKNNKVTSTVEYDISKMRIDSVQAAGGLKRLTAAITVAQQMTGTGADRKAIVRTPEEMEKLRRIVSSALGTDATRGDSVALEELPFNDQFATDMTQQLDSQQKRDFYFNIVRNLTYPALGLVALFILLRAFKSTPVQEIPIGVPVGRLAQNGNSTGNSNGRFGDFSQEEQPGVVTVDVLNRLIKDNPNNMTHAIRDWMSRGRPTE